MTKKTSPPKLKTFYWRGVNRIGESTSGKLFALSEKEVRSHLIAQEVKIKKIKIRRISSLDKLKNSATQQDITLFTRQMATMLEAGVPLIQSLQLIAENNTKAEMKSILKQICLSIESGAQLSKSLMTICSHFDSFYIDLIATGEETGNLAHAFIRLAKYREKSDALRRKVIKAMIYPCIIMIVAISVTVLMLTVVIPEFENIFNGFGAELPWLTKKIITLSHLLQNNGWIICINIFTLYVILNQALKKSYRLRMIFSKHILSIPIIGTVITKAIIAKLSRTLATSLSSGLPILYSLQTTSKTTANLYFKTAITSVLQNTAAGMPLYLAMRQTQAFPEMTLQMIMIGEESGKLDDMLNKIAHIYEVDVDNIVDNLGKILEPFIIVFLGLVIGGLIIAMYLPIFDLMSVIS